MAPRFIVDVDGGQDDCLALMLALTARDSCSKPMADVLAVTCVHGNVTVDQTLQNTLTVLELCERHDIPIFRGASMPLIPMRADSPYKILSTPHHWHDGIVEVTEGGARIMDTVSKEPAALAIIRLVNKYPGEVTLVCLAPLTNIALAFKLDPGLGGKLKHLIIMGGNIEGRGRVSACAEFNFYSDPEAACIVLNEAASVTMVPYETCLNHGLSWDWYDQWINQDTHKAYFIKEITGKYTRSQREKGKSTYIACDPIAMAVAIDGSVALVTEEKRCNVELGGHLTRGQVIWDWFDSGVFKMSTKCRIVLELDQQKLANYLQSMAEP